MDLIENILKEFDKIKQGSAEELEFYSDAYLALSAVNPELVNQYLVSTRTLPWFKQLEKDLAPKIASLTYQFFYELKTLQIKTQKETKHYTLTSAREIIKEMELNSSIEGIVSKGFLLQPETYKIIQLSLNL